MPGVPISPNFAASLGRVGALLERTLRDTEARPEVGGRVVCESKRS